MSLPDPVPAERPLVTMAVTGYRQEHLVRHAVASAFAQTYRPLEIILSDDCSPDGTFAVMEEMAAAYRGPHTVRLNRNPVNLGIVGHTNHVWQLANGALLTACHGDDIAEPTKVERLVEAWRAGAGKVTAVHSCMMQIDEDGNELGLRFPPKVSTENPSPKEWLTAWKYAIGATVLYDRRIMEFFGDLPEFCLIEDTPMIFRAILLGQLAYVDEPLVRYRVGGVSSGRPGEMSPGAAFLRGFRLKRKAWRLSNARCALYDLEKVTFPEKEACIEILREKIKKYEFEVGLWQAGPWRRVAMIPEGMRRSFSMRSSHPLRQALRHTLSPLFVAYYNLRYGAAQRSRAAPRRR